MLTRSFVSIRLNYEDHILEIVVLRINYLELVVFRMNPQHLEIWRKLLEGHEWNKVNSVFYKVLQCLD